MPNTFPACACFAHEGSDEALAGSLEVKQFSLLFEAENLRLEFEYQELDLDLDAEDKQKILFRHPAHPDWELYTYSNEILDHRLLLQRSNLREQIRLLQRLRHGPSRHTLVVFGVVGAMALALLLLWAADEVIVGIVIDQIPSKWESDLGKHLMEEERADLTFITDPARTNYLNMVAERLVKALPQHAEAYKFYLVDDPRMNAFALPGGYVIVLSGLLDQVDTPEELAGVLAHEIAHVNKRHGLRKSAVAAGPTLALRYCFGNQSGLLSTLAATSTFLGNQQYSRTYETEADDVGLDYLIKASIDPKGMLSFMRKLKKAEGRGGGDPELFSSHPATERRIQRIEEKLRGLKSGEFKPFPRLKPSVGEPVQNQPIR